MSHKRRAERAAFIKFLSIIVLTFFHCCTVYSHERDNSAIQATSPPISEYSGTAFQGFLLQVANQTAAVEPENEAARAVAVIIHWLIVPFILLTIFLYALSLPYRDSKDFIKKSGTAGIFAGLIVFLIFVVTRPS